MTKKLKTVRQGTARGRDRKPMADIAMVVARDEEGVHILRRRSQESPVELGLLKPMRDGHPITGEVLTLKQRDDIPFFYDVRSEFGGPEAPETSEAKQPGDGPAHVTSDAYRRGWDAVFARRRDRSIN